MIINMDNSTLPAETVYSYYNYYVTAKMSQSYSGNEIVINDSPGWYIYGIFGYMKPSSTNQKPFAQAYERIPVQQNGDDTLRTDITWTGLTTSTVTNNNPAGTAGTIYYHLLHW